MKINSSIQVINSPGNNTLQKALSDEPKDTIQEKPEDEMAKLKKQLAQMQAAMNDTNKQLEEIKNNSGIKNQYHFHLDSEAYKNISQEEGFKMLGYFTEKCLNSGYPWKLLKPGGFRNKGREISLMEAVKRLNRGEEVMMQPMRIMDLDLSPTALATVASVASPAAAAVAAAADLAKKTNVTTKPVGHESKFGAPVTVHNFSELKLLTELYNPSSKEVKGDKLSETAKNLGKFVQTVNSNYPWKILKDEEDGKLWRVIKGSIAKGFQWAIVGAGVGAIIGGIGGLIAQKLASFAILGMTGVAGTSAAVGVGAGIAGTIKGGKQALIGKEINSFEALDRILSDKPVIFQQEKMNSIGIPIVGTHNYFTEYGKDNVITGSDELKLFSNVLPETTNVPTEAKKE